MGYTHYWTHTRDFSVEEWKGVEAALAAIIRAGISRDIVLGNAHGEPGTGPDICGDLIAFNGVEESAHETFLVNRDVPPLESWQKEERRGWDFCKTAHKPYDVVVTACLAYLASNACPAPWTVSSDGTPAEWAPGVELARAALPGLAHQIAVPQDVTE